jgi:transcriptional regulator with XRE-family HTH domain
MGSTRLRQQRLAEKLLQIRLSLGLSQSEMLRKLDAEDLITYHQISGFETGRREPPLLILLRYARVAGVSTDVLIDDELDLPNKLPTKPKHK